MDQNGTERDKPYSEDGDLDACERGATAVLAWAGDAVTPENAKLMAADILALVADVAKLRAENVALRESLANAPTR